MSYRAELWGPGGEDGDRLVAGQGRATEEEAKADLAALRSRCDDGTAWAFACVDGPNGRVHKAPDPDAPDEAPTPGMR